MDHSRDLLLTIHICNLFRNSYNLSVTLSTLLFRHYNPDNTTILRHGLLRGTRRIAWGEVSVLRTHR